MRSTDDMHALPRRCDGVIQLLFATVGVMWVAWLMISTWAYHGGISLANTHFTSKHPEMSYEQVSPLGVGDIGYQVARSYTSLALFGVVIPATVMTLIAWLMVRRLRKEIAQRW
jgi:hypothetical protein